MEFLKRILSLNSPAKNMVINIISYTFLGFMTYLFISIFNIPDTVRIFIFSILSFAIFMYISDNFKLSNYKFIKFLQIFVFILTIFGFIVLILYLFDLNIFDISYSLEQATQSLTKKIEGYETLSKNIKDSEILNPNELVKAIESFKTTGKTIEEGQQSIISKLDKILEEISRGGGSGSQSQYTQDISNFLNSLSFEQTVAIVHITGCVAILISLLSLFLIFYGNILIDVLQLEKRFPRIARIIQWRRKFQMYYSLIDFIIIFSVSSIMIYINLLTYGS